MNALVRRQARRILTSLSLFLAAACNFGQAADEDQAPVATKSSPDPTPSDLPLVADRDPRTRAWKRERVRTPAQVFVRAMAVPDAPDALEVGPELPLWFWMQASGEVVTALAWKNHRQLREWLHAALAAEQARPSSPTRDELLSVLGTACV